MMSGLLPAAYAAEVVTEINPQAVVAPVPTESTTIEADSSAISSNEASLWIQLNFLLR